VEEEMQRALMHILLGRRLWRWVAMGQKEPDMEPDDVNLYKMFITYSFEVQPVKKAN